MCPREEEVGQGGAQHPALPLGRGPPESHRAAEPGCRDKGRTGGHKAQTLLGRKEHFHRLGQSQADTGKSLPMSVSCSLKNLSGQPRPWLCYKIWPFKKQVQRQRQFPTRTRGSLWHRARLVARCANRPRPPVQAGWQPGSQSSCPPLSLFL